MSEAEVETPPLTFQFEPEPSKEQKVLWDAFIAEYAKDWNPLQAACRVGFNLHFAQEYARVFLSQPYVQRKIQTLKREIDPELEDLDKVRKFIKGNLLELAQNGDPKTRNAALRNLMVLEGFDQAPDRSGEALKDLVDHFKSVTKELPD